LRRTFQACLVTGLGLVGIRYSLVDSYPDQYEEINHSVVGIKLVILIIILSLGYLNAKKQVFFKESLASNGGSIGEQHSYSGGLEVR
jgi:hypothetical protein